MASITLPRRLDFLTSYARQDPPADDAADDDLVIPEDLTELDTEALDDLAEKAEEAFEGLYGDGKDVSSESLDQLESLADGMDKIRGEQTRRETERNERTEKARKLADRVHPSDEGEVVAEVDADSGEVTDKEAGKEEGKDAEQSKEPEAVAASADKSTRISLSGLKRKKPQLPTTESPLTMADVVLAAPDLPAFSNGQGMTWDDIGKAVDRRLSGYQHATYQAAHDAGQALSQSFGVAVMKRPFEPELAVEAGDGQAAMDRALNYAMSESRLPGGSLVAAAGQSSGWCAPSEILYDLCEMESRDGLISVPEMAIRRGGIRWTTGPDFASIYADTGFCFTEQEVIDGNYDGQGGGTKPCYYVPCPEFQEERMDVCGVCIQAGLLQTRGYPEMISRITRGALIAFAHKMSANVVNKLVSLSTAVSLPASQVGTTAPILTAIELQREHMLYLHRMSRNTTLEAIFPFWVRGAIRSDLSRRLGVDMIDVPDSRIDAWFRSRGISPQFVYNWQGLESLTPANATSWPSSVQFLLYPAGTFVKGTTDVINLSTLYDSTLLGTNDFTALFMEEGWMIAKLCHDARVVTVPICPDGSTGAGVEIACDGTAASDTVTVP